MSGDGYSGRVLVRMPSSLHALLSAEAERDGVSLNQFTVAALAAAVRWRTEDQPPVYTPEQRAELARQVQFKAESVADGYEPAR